MNQSELEAKTRDRRQARENACDQIAIGLVLHLIGWEANASFFNQSERSKAKPKQLHSIENRSMNTDFV